MAAQLAQAKAMMANKAAGTTATTEKLRMSDEFWARVDTLELSEEEAREYLGNSSKEYPIDGMIVVKDAQVRAIREDYVVDRRKGDGKTKLLFPEGKKEPTVERVMAHALEGKVSLVGAIEVEGTCHRGYFGVNLNGQVFRTGMVANTALAIAKALKGDPVILLAEVVPGYEEA